jgi:hypothetical protein
MAASDLTLLGEQAVKRAKRPIKIAALSFIR